MNTLSDVQLGGSGAAVSVPHKTPPSTPTATKRQKIVVVVKGNRDRRFGPRVVAQGKDTCGY